MIKKVCDIYQFGESYIFHPKNNSSLENLCLVPCENHIGSNFESSNIFDFRTEILNKCINSNIHFYVILLDENMREIALDNVDINGSSLIYSFNRKKEKQGSKIKLTYYPKINKFDLSKNRNIIYLGTSDKIHSRQVAYENTSCFSNFFSSDGGGYYGFNIKINNLDIQPKHAVLLGYKKQLSMRMNNNYFLNNRVQRVFDQEQNNIIPSAPSETYIIQSSTPPMEEINIPGYIEEV